MSPPLVNNNTRRPDRVICSRTSLATAHTNWRASVGLARLTSVGVVPATEPRTTVAIEAASSPRRHHASLCAGIFRRKRNKRWNQKRSTHSRELLNHLTTGACTHDRSLGRRRIDGEFGHRELIERKRENLRACFRPSSVTQHSNDAFLIGSGIEHLDDSSSGRVEQVDLIRRRVVDEQIVIQLVAKQVGAK